MQLVVFEDAGYVNLLPLVYSRATFNLRCGFDNLLAKIETAMGRTADSIFVRKSLAGVMGERQTRRVNQPVTTDDQIWVNGRWLLRKQFDIPLNSAAWAGDVLLAARVDRSTGCKLHSQILADVKRVRDVAGGLAAANIPEDAGRILEYPWQLVEENGTEIKRQAAAFQVLGKVYAGAHLVNEQAIHIGECAKIKPGAVLDAEDGPVWIGDNATIGPNAVITGPCYIGEGCVVRPGASISASSIGMVCKVGGEIEGTIFHGYSNKQHDGFIGHSYVGEWVNLGADTVGSDLKNTYGNVSVPINGRPVDTGQTFVGAFIGDHTKTAIGTKLPTGCVIGYGCNIAASGFVPKFVPSFSWLTEKGLEANEPQKGLAVARTVVGRRGRKYSRQEETLFLAILEESKMHEGMRNAALPR